MSASHASLFDVRLAWRRTMLDEKDRVFIRHPYEVSCVRSDLHAWLAELDDDLAHDRFTPSSVQTCAVPKPGGLIRPGANLTLKDRVAYAAAVGSCYPAIHHALHWAQGTHDFGYRLAFNAGAEEWIRNGYEGWKHFRDKSIDRLANGVPYVVMTDITGFYDNIEISILLSDLRAIGCPSDAVKLLGECLNRWSHPRGRGIPQGYSASDILAKVYLHSVDQALVQDSQQDHIRFVDDLRLFCRSTIDAKIVLMNLAGMLRQRGLALQGAKTKVLRADGARKEIEGIIPTIDDMSRAYRKELKQLAGYIVDASGMTNAELEKALDEIGEPDPPPAVLREAFDNYIVNEGAKAFNKSIFHYILNRLKRHKDDYAVPYVISWLEPRPEETSAILDYLQAVAGVATVSDALLDFLQSKACIYDYQVYQIVEWFANAGELPERVLVSARHLASANRTPGYVRAWCRKLLGDFGTYADLEALHAAYDEDPNPLGQCEIICGLWRLEVARRNAFLARVSGDGEMHARAARLVRAGGLAP